MNIEIKNNGSGGLEISQVGYHVEGQNLFLDVMFNTKDWFLVTQALSVHGYELTFSNSEETANVTLCFDVPKSHHRIFYERAETDHFHLLFPFVDAPLQNIGSYRLRYRVYGEWAKYKGQEEGVEYLIKP